MLLTTAVVSSVILASPRFIGAETYGVSPGNELIWRIPVHGATAVEAVVLPDGVTFDAARRTLRGRIAAPGEYRVTLKATDGKESVMQTVTLKVGDALCLAPPMGWNSWYSYSEAVSQEHLEKVARLLEETGLADAGWSYVNIDDCWQGERLKGEALQPNEKFPDMKAMCESIHARGLKAGIYSTPWVSTYAGFRGGSANDDESKALSMDECLQSGQLYGRWPGLSQRKVNHTGKYWLFDRDAKQFADWGFDYIKMDWKPNDIPTTKRIAKDLRASGRDIVLSLSNEAPIQNAPQLSKTANLWRTTGDIRDTWGSIRNIAREQLRWIPYRSEGHWNDPDILQIGNIGTSNQKNTTFRPTRLTPAEQHYQMALWCMLSAPLLISNDLESLSPETKALLTNPDLIELNQKYGTAPLTLVEQTKDYFILRKNLTPDGKSWVLGVFNDSEREISITLSLDRFPNLPFLKPLTLTVPSHSARLEKR